MTSSSVKKVQDKLFGRTQTPGDTALQGTGGVDPPSLTINIPKPEATPTVYPARKNTDSSPKQDAGEDTFIQATESIRRPYRERLAQQVGDDYNGAEKYRLREDDERKKHWKKWGPYLSDRQWVRSFEIVFFTSSLAHIKFRLPSEKTTRLMVMLGATSLMLMPDPEHTDGGKMVSPVFLIIVNAYALACLSGMERIQF
jgi:hypothetical protein